MTFRVLVDKNVPRGLEAAYANAAVKAAEARAKAQEAERETERQRQKAIKEEQEALRLHAAKKKERDEEHAREVGAARLDVDLRMAFFSANPSGDESAFKRLLPDLRDDLMRQKTVEGFESAKARKRARYGSF